MDKEKVLELIQKLNEKQTETICIKLKQRMEVKRKNIMILYQAFLILWVELYCLELKKRK